MLQVYDNIRKRRKELGYTQDELAKKVGYSERSMIGKIEKGEVDLSQSKILKFADALNTTASALMGLDGIVPELRKGYLPLYGCVCAGNGIFADNYIEEWVSVGNAYNAEEYFVLNIKGDSMEPEMHDGDSVIVKKQETAQDNDYVIALVNGDEGVCKQLKRYKEGMALVSLNPQYPPRYFSEEEVTGIPVRILGKVVESRRLFK